MATNVQVIAQRKTMPYTASATHSAGDIIVVAGIVCVFPVDAVSGDKVNLEYDAVEIVAPLTDGLGTLAAGTRMYYDSSAESFTNVANAYPAGPLRVGAVEADTTCTILLNSPSNTGDQLSDLLTPYANLSALTDESSGTDPGDGTIAAITEATGVAITYTANDPSITPDGAVTVADGSTPTVSELLELAEEALAQSSTNATAINACKDAIAQLAAHVESIRAGNLSTGIMAAAS